MSNARNRFVRYVATVCTAALALSLLTSARGETGLDASAHAVAYREAAANVAAANVRLRSEIENVQSGKVAHFDFLQFEHIEILRHARALQYPPGSTDDSQRRALIEQAGRVLAATEALEWPIADFLRSHAVLDSAISNTIDLARSATATADSSTRTVLQNLMQAATNFQGLPSATKQRALYDALEEALASAAMDNQWRRELTNQQTLIEANQSAYTKVLAALAENDLAAQTETLSQLLK